NDFRDLVPADPRLGKDLADPFTDGSRIVVRRRRDLLRPDLSVGAEEHQVGERAADVDAQPVRATLCSQRVALRSNPWLQDDDDAEMDGSMRHATGWIARLSSRALRPTAAWPSRTPGAPPPASSRARRGRRRSAPCP